MTQETPELPQTWTLASLEDIALIIQGQSPPGSTYNTEGHGLPFFQGKAEFGDIYPTAAKWCSAPTKLADPDDVLVSVRAPVGPTNLAPNSCSIGRGLAAIRPIDGVPSRYILYGIRATVGSLTSQATGSTFAAISGDVLRRHLIPIAPLLEQQRIVAEIEKHFTRLDAAVAALQRARANLKRYRASVLNAACEGRLVPTEAELARAEGRDYEPADVLLERILKERHTKWEADQVEKMRAAGKEPEDGHWKNKYKEPAPPDVDGLSQVPDGWGWATGDMLFTFVTSGSRGWARYYADDGPLFLRIGNLDHDSISLDLRTIQRVRPPSGAEGTRTRVRAGDILLSITADVGMIALIPEHLDEAYINQHIALARPVNLVYPPYVAWFLAAESGGRCQLNRLQRGATKVGLGLDDIRAVAVAMPPHTEQERIVCEIERRLSVLAELETALEHAVQRANRLRQSILKGAFEGKLVPQDRSDEPASVLLKRIRAERERETMQRNARRSTNGRAPSASRRQRKAK